MLRTLPVGLVIALTTQACFLLPKGDPHPVQAEVTPTSVTLPDLTYDAPQYAVIDIRNTGATTVFVSAGTWLANTLENGSGGVLSDEEVAQLVTIDMPPFSPVYPEQIQPMEISIDPSRWRWASGTYTVRFPFEVRYLWNGQDVDEPFDATAREAPEPQLVLPDLDVTFTIDCDLDDDGFDATECGGLDCFEGNDGNRINRAVGAKVFPGADEFCDGVDQDCDGAVDEDAIDAEVFHPDGDSDGYPDEEISVRACAPPSDGTLWLKPRNDGRWDCDDEHGATSPIELESGLRCSDGIDNDCDGDVDTEDADCQ